MASQRAIHKSAAPSVQPKQAEMAKKRYKSAAVAANCPLFDYCCHFSQSINVAAETACTERPNMSFVTTKDGTDIFYKDWGSKDAQPIMFHHGWPLSSDDWDAQMLFFLSKGYRVVAHDRRGHGRSTQVSEGHDWITMPPMPLLSWSI